MRRIILILFMSTCFNMEGQDPSFSQFDLNMNYTNPAFTSYEGGTKILLHSRNQWNKVNENFNNSILEVSGRVPLNKDNRKIKTAWCFGGSVISEDLESFPEIGNSVFLNKKEISLYPFTLEMKIFKNGYISAAPLNISFRKYDLQSHTLVFTDMINNFNDVISSSSFSPSTYIHNEWIADLSYGFIYTRHGKFSNTKTNRWNIGFSSHHILKPIESFGNTNSKDAKIPTKYTVHSEWYSAIPKQNRPSFPYYRAMIKHERYRKDGESILGKTEIGGTAFLNNTPIEFGCLFRINNLNPVDSNPANLQSWIPILRYRINRGKHLYIISYSYDYNTTPLSEYFQSTSSGNTHELGFIVYLFSGNNKNKSCAGFDTMGDNPLYQDNYNNRSYRKPMKNWKSR